MAIKLSQLSIFLNIVQSFENDPNTKSKLNILEKMLRHTKLEHGQLIDVDGIIQFSMDSNLIKIQDNIIHIEKDFHEILDLFKSEENEKIKKILRTKFLSNPEIHKLFSTGLKDFNKGRIGYWIELEKVIDSFKNIQFVEILWELDVLQSEKNIAIINSELKIQDDIIRKITEQPQTQAQLDKIKAIQKQVGEIAEKFVIEFEKQRLKEEHCDEKIDKINQISITNTRAGYDIESFNDKSSLSYDRFIEVKGSINKKFDIHWSVNEINKAKEHPDKYWLYFVSEIDLETGTCPNTPELYPNPFVNIFQNKSEFDQQEEIQYRIKRKSL
jgi:hypothetical protein